MSKKMPYDKHIYNLENLIEIQCADGDVPRLIWDYFCPKSFVLLRNPIFLRGQFSMYDLLNKAGLQNYPL